MGNNRNNFNHLSKNFNSIFISAFASAFLCSLFVFLDTNLIFTMMFLLKFSACFKNDFLFGMFGGISFQINTADSQCQTKLL